MVVKLRHFLKKHNLVNVCLKMKDVNGNKADTMFKYVQFVKARHLLGGFGVFN